MDLLGSDPEFNLLDKNLRIYSKSPALPPHYMGRAAEVRNSIVSEGCEVYGKVTRSVLFTGAQIGENAEITDSIIMPNAIVGENAVIKKAIIAEGAVVGAGAVIGAKRRPEDGDYDTSLTGDITLIANSVTINEGERVPVGMIVK